jgi:hypothetical protein
VIINTNGELAGKRQKWHGIFQCTKERTQKTSAVTVVHQTRQNQIQARQVSYFNPLVDDTVEMTQKFYTWWGKQTLGRNFKLESVRIAITILTSSPQFHLFEWCQ